MCYHITMENIKNEKGVENKSICEKCGGICCKKSGCGYIVKDFTSFRYADLKALLDEGNISIKSCLYSYVANGDLKHKQVLVLKARSFDKGIVDLVSASTRCKLWTEKGCPYPFEKRPSLGTGLIPNPKGECSESTYNIQQVLDEWCEHQLVLEKLVKAYTGKKAWYVYEEQFVDTVSKIMVKQIKDERLTLGEEEIAQSLPILSDVYPYLMKESKTLAVATVYGDAQKKVENLKSASAMFYRKDGEAQ